MKRLSQMLRATLTLSVAVAPFACRTTNAGSDAKGSSDVTVDNGRVAASAIVLQYESIGGGINTKAKRAIDAVITEARDAGKLETELVRPWGFEGESTACVQFKDQQEMQVYRRKICLLIKDGNAATGMKLTSHQITQNCTDAAIAQPIQGNDQDCDK